MKIYKVGKYIRLSNESKGYHKSGEDSVSIENQEAMLSKFIGMMPDWIETRTYVDDGASGANFNRQGFLDMMEDVRAGVINLVIVKDLSRFGRNYLEAGRYLEEELPALGCRFVSLSDGIDTENGENDIMPFLNAVNDFYVRDVRRRIKSVMTAKAKEGHKLSGTTPYGYDINPKERHRLIIDSYASNVVRKMFELRATGMGYSKVAGELNKENILPPRLYYFKRQERETTAIITAIWTSRTVKLMLNNEVYIGHTVSLKRGTRSYRDSREYKRDENEWIRVENTHSAIIDIELWDKVQALNNAVKANAANASEPKQSLFSGLVVCSDCCTKMGYIKRQEVKKDGRIAAFGAYGCRTYTRSGGTACSTHRILEKNLKLIVLSQISEMAQQIKIDESGIAKQLMERLVGDQKTDTSAVIREVRKLEQQLYVLDNQIEVLYDDRFDERITNAEFAERASRIEASRAIAESRFELLNQSIEEVKDKHFDISRWTSLIKEKSTALEVDRELLEALIEKIEIGERVVTDGGTTQDIRIFYRHVGCITTPSL